MDDQNGRDWAQERTSGTALDSVSIDGVVIRVLSGKDGGRYGSLRYFIAHAALAFRKYLTKPS